uniref:Uncharacterized protein n=1 Tax=Octopus bimaculoides TaxID=37653 RepID=A0A0L8G7R7_OCTBM
MNRNFSSTGITQISALKNKHLTVLKFLYRKTTFSSLTSLGNEKYMNISL